GNVWEWTNAWFKPYRGNESSDAAFGEQYRVIRGGSWINFEGNTRVSNRGKYYPSDTSLLLGFRCAKDPDDTAVPVAGQLKGYGYVLVATPGTWADIFVNGERLGQTPQSDTHHIGLPSAHSACQRRRSRAHRFRVQPERRSHRRLPDSRRTPPKGSGVPQ
ncbi:MAG: SUMF1/EgtB/PvdO family nonheme iron enzyme, partial [Gemmatimonadales bacterium]|nr:SUMF1/EgtB/PvdO family nonheme iron enzyme [Gemmatimonadales bacterium]